MADSLEAYTDGAEVLDIFPHAGFSQDRSGVTGPVFVRAKVSTGATDRGVATVLTEIWQLDTDTCGPFELAAEPAFAPPDVSAGLAHGVQPVPLIAASVVEGIVIFAVFESLAIGIEALSGHSTVEAGLSGLDARNFTGFTLIENTFDAAFNVGYPAAIVVSSAKDLSEL